jgi:hypothetical protein
MSRVSAFYGIVIFFLYNEDGHEGRPHFHADFAGQWVSYDIETVKPLGAPAASATSACDQVGALAPGRASRQLASRA